MQIEEDDINLFLAHYGVKGMKWGVRKERRSGQRNSNNKRLTTINKIALGTLGASLIAGTAFVAGRTSGARGKVPISEMNRGTAKLVRDIGLNYSNGILKSNDRTSLAVIRNTARQIEGGYLNILK